MPGAEMHAALFSVCLFPENLVSSCCFGRFLLARACYMYYNISEWAYFNLMWKTTKKRCDNNRKDVASMRVGMLTSGGDCQSLNATMRGVAKSLYKMYDDVEIIGFEDGYKGLMYADYQIMNHLIFLVF